MQIIFPMRTIEAVKLFGTQAALAKALTASAKGLQSVNQCNVSLWGEYPPPWRQLQIELITRGLLQAEPGIMPRPVISNYACSPNKKRSHMRREDVKIRQKERMDV